VVHGDAPHKALQEASVIRQLLYIFFYEKNFSRAIVDHTEGFSCSMEEMEAMGFAWTNGAYETVKGSEKVSSSYDGQGYMFRSGQFSGMPVPEAKTKMGNWMEKKGFAKKTVTYSVRDWLISRQRYWGTPIPVIYCGKCGTVPVPEKDLPVVLPTDVQFSGKGNPLKTSKSFTEAKCPICKGRAQRETDTMDTFVDSSWYFLRYCSPKARDSAFDRNSVKYWMTVDQYIGGVEHAVMHLMYARFFTMVLKDMGLVDFDEPFLRLFNQGIVYKDGHKMSKSFGNVVTQEEMAETYGIDTARLFLLFVSSPESQLEWSNEGIQGAYRFINKIYRMTEENMGKISLGRYSAAGSEERMVEAILNITVENVSRQIEDFQFNLAISGIMELVNHLSEYAKNASVNRELFGNSMKVLLQIVSPFAPHLAEELWEKIGLEGFVSSSRWPTAGKADMKVIAAGAVIDKLRDDIAQVLKLSGIAKPVRIGIVAAPQWKYELFSMVKKEMETTRNAGEIMKRVMSNEKLRPYGKDISRLVPHLVSSPERMPGTVLSAKEELEIFRDMQLRLEQDFGCAVIVESAEKSHSKKALQALPGKPGIEIL